MSLIASEGNSREYTPLEPGVYTAICYQLIDLGLQYNEQFENSSRKVRIGWELPEETREYDGETYTATVGKTYTISLNSKSALRKDLIAWRGRDFTVEELKAFDLRNIVGVPCQIQIIHTERNGKKYTNIAGIMKLPKSMTRPAATRPPEIYDIDSDDPARVEDFPDWLKETIKNSESYIARLERMADELPPAPTATVEEIDDEDGLPF